MSHAGHRILFDPFVPMNTNIQYTSVQELAQMGDIFITHGHFDHIIRVPEVLALGKSKVHCSAETAQQLIRAGASAEQVVSINPGDTISHGPFTIRVHKGQHIKNDLQLVLKTIFNRRIVSHYKELINIVKAHKKCPQGQVLVYEISLDNIKILHLGSLNLCSDEEYPQDVNVLCLPLQGRSDLLTYALVFVEKIKPQSIFLHHFDDAFPPISSTIDCNPFADLVRRSYPSIAVTIPEYGISYPVQGMQ